ncbi:hypothetical protein ACQHIH_10770 [Xanthomonas sontii]|uniref:hypothetical protein n=1 Tax=Xanthomonas sontii TaxID=2650745 RepID=UPI00388AE22A
MSFVVGQNQQRLAHYCEPFEKQKLSPGGESLFFACAKKSNQKKAHPAFAPAARVRSASGIFGRGILPRPKTAHVPVRRPPAGGFARQLRRCGGDPVEQEQNNSNSNRKSGSCGYRSFGFGVVASRAVSLVGQGPAGVPLMVVGRWLRAGATGRSFVAVNGVSG